MSKKKNEFAKLDEFLEWYKTMRPETVYVVKNKKRYEEIMCAIQTLSELAEKSNPGCVKCEHGIDELTGTSIGFEIISDQVDFCEMDLLTKALAIADNLEVYSKTDGKMAIGIVFNDAYNLAPSYEELHDPFPEFLDIPYKTKDRS